MCKDKIKKLMWILGLRATLPASIINQVKIDENHEKLVCINDDKTLFFSEELKQRDNVYLRKTAYNKIKTALESLPLGYKLKIYSAYRPIEEQKALWEAKYKQFKQKYPDISEDELTKKIRAVCADPRRGFGGHQTGGAIDLSLCDENGADYDMGTQYREINQKTPTKSKLLSEIQIKNRKLLSKAMEKAGFKNYPNEWWHFCYGDRMWAAYSNKKACLYGLPVEKGQ